MLIKIYVTSACPDGLTGKEIALLSGNGKKSSSVFPLTANRIGIG